MEDNNWLEVVNLDKLVDFSRKVIYHNFDEQYAELSDKDFLNKIDTIENVDSKEMDRILSHDETKMILSELMFKKRNKKTKKVHYFIKEEDYDQALVQLNQRMVSNIVQGLVSKGVLETAFDDEKEELVFWVKRENEQEKNEDH